MILKDGKHIQGIFKYVPGIKYELGDFVIEENPANDVIASEPVKSFDFAGTTSAAVVYFVPTYDYEGFKIAGAAVEATGDEVDADHANLYKATLATGAVSIAKVGL